MNISPSIATVTASAAGPFPLNVAAALRTIDTWTDLIPLERREMRRALNKIVEQDGRPADAIPFTPALVRRLILQPKAAVLGLSSSRKSAIVGYIRRIMQRLDLIEAETVPCTEAWDTLLNCFDDPRERATFTALARFCSARQIAPEGITAAVLRDLLEHLTTRTLTAHPTKVVSAARGAWNRCGRTIPDWPGPVLPGLWPQPPELSPAFLADLERFATRLRGPTRDTTTFVHPSQRQGKNALLKAAPRQLRETTIALRQAHCRWAAYTLIATGVPAGQVTSLAVLVDQAGVILGRLFQDAGDKPSARGMHVAEVLLMIARHYDKRSDEEIEWLQNMAQMVKVEYKGITAKNERCVLAVLEPARDETLLRLPGALMQAAQTRRADHPRKAAGLAWRAVFLEILLTIPLRLANIQRLRLDRHLYRPDPRTGCITAVMIPADETKNDREVRMPVAAPLSAMLARFLADFRPHLADPGCVYLFPGQDTGNTPLTPQAMRDALKALTARYLGIPISPHQFRHIAVERFRREYPGEWHLMSQMLNHASPETTKRAYGRNDNRAAFVRYDGIVTGLRARLRSKPRARPKPTPTPRRGRKGA